MFELKVISFFSAAHSLRGYKGKCESFHGHNWKVELIVGKDKLNSQGLLLDFKELKAILNSVIGELDHRDLNQIDFFKKNNPSSENIAYFIYTKIKPLLEKKEVKIKKVIVWEQRDSSASYSE